MGEIVECPKRGGFAGEYALATSTWTCAKAGCSARLCIDPRMTGVGAHTGRDAPTASRNSECVLVEELVGVLRRLTADDLKSAGWSTRDGEFSRLRDDNVMIAFKVVPGGWYFISDPHHE